MKAVSKVFALFVVVSLIPMQEAAAQEQGAAVREAQDAALVKLKERGFVRENAIYGEDFIEQVAAGNLEVVKLFLAAGMSPDTRDVIDVRKRNALLMAAEHGHADVVQALVEAGADVGVKDRSGRTPLVVAVMYEQDEVVQVLLKKQQN